MQFTCKSQHINIGYITGSPSFKIMDNNQLNLFILIHYYHKFICTSNWIIMVQCNSMYDRMNILILKSGL